MRKLILFFVVLLPLSVWAPLSVCAMPLVQYSEGKTRITVERQTSRGKPSIAVKIQGSKVSDVDIFTLAGPNRIVADIGSIPSKRSKSFAISEVNKVKSIRLGAFEEKMRVVIDIAGDNIPGYSWVEGKNSLTLLVYDGPAPQSQAAKIVPVTQQAAPVEQALVAPQAVTAPAPEIPQTVQLAAAVVAPVNVVRLVKRIEAPGLGLKAETVSPLITPKFPEPTTESAASVVAELDADSSKPMASLQSPPVEPQSQAVVSASPNAGLDFARLGVPEKESLPTVPMHTGPALTSIDFEHDTSGSPRISLKLSGPPQFNIAKTGLLEYKMTITDVVLASSAVGLPQFPPQDFEGITVILASQLADRIEVVIGVERGYRLLPSSSGNEIWITAERLRRVA